MKQVLSPEIREVLDAVHYRPAVSVIIPLNIKTNLQTEAAHKLKSVLDQAERELLANYPDEVSHRVMEKLRRLAKEVRPGNGRKSLAIYASPLFEKLLYLDILVEEKLIIDESFEIRDLVYSKKQVHKFLVLLLSNKESHLFLGNGATLSRIITDIPSSSLPFQNDVPEKVGNFSDMSARKETLMDKFLSHIDKSLSQVLYAYKLPLFVIAPDRVLGHFRQLTNNADHVLNYISGNHENATTIEIMKLLEPYISEWEARIETELLRQLEEATGRKKLVAGINEVWREAGNNKGRLLVVEKNFMCPASHVAAGEIVNNADMAASQFSSIRDAVDDIIEKVIAAGGDVEFTAPGKLNQYQHIALILHY